jgi:hypothetical protein
MRSRVLKAVNDALSGDSGDEYANLFPPWQPLGPDEGHVEYRAEPLIYPGEQQGQRNRQPQRGYTAAAPLSDDEVYDALFGAPGQDGEGVV